MRYAFLIFFAAAPAYCATRQFYPLDRDASVPEIVESYSSGQSVHMDCIARDIDLGERKLDEHKRVIHIPFPKCRETSLPLTFAYGVDIDQQCTVAFTDELYHLFQLYLHEDVPFSCRVPLSPEAYYMEKGGAHVPLTLNFRGSIYDLHLELDTSMNVLFTAPESDSLSSNTIVSAVAYGLGTDTTKVAVGDHVTLDFAVRWLRTSPVTISSTDGLSGPFPQGFYKLPMQLVLSPEGLVKVLRFVAGASTMLFVVTLVVGVFAKKRNRYKLPDQEVGKSD